MYHMTPVQGEWLIICVQNVSYDPCALVQGDNLCTECIL